MTVLNYLPPEFEEIVITESEVLCLSQQAEELENYSLGAEI